MVDIEIYAWSSLLLISRITWSCILVSWKVFKIQPIRVAYTKPINLNKFARHLRLNTETGGTLLFKKNPVFHFSLLNLGKNGLRRKSKCVHWILRLSNRDQGYLILKFSALIIFNQFFFWSNQIGITRIKNINIFRIIWSDKGFKGTIVISAWRVAWNWVLYSGVYNLFIYYNIRKQTLRWFLGLHCCNWSWRRGGLTFFMFFLSLFFLSLIIFWLNECRRYAIK